MRTRTTRILLPLLSMALWLTPRAARAGDSDYHVLSYRVHAGCPSQSSFQARVEARASSARAVAADQAGHAFSVTVEEDGAESRGQIQLSSDASDIRSVSGTDCAEVIDALALIAAVTIDPHSALGPGSDSGPAPEPVRPEPKPEPVGERTPLPPAPKPRSRPLLLRIGLRGLALFGVGPAPLFGVGVLVGRGGDAWPLELRLMAELAQSATVDRGPGSVKTQYAGGGAEFCPVGLIFRPLHVSGCAAFRGGVRSAEGQGVDQPKTAHDLWLGVGPSGHIEVKPTDFLFTELGGGVEFPLVRHDLVFDQPAYVAYEPPVIAGNLQLTLGLLFR